MIPSLFGTGTEILLTLGIQITLLATVALLFALFVRSAAVRHCILGAALVGIATAPISLAAARCAGVTILLPIHMDSETPDARSPIPPSRPVVQNPVASFGVESAHQTVGRQAAGPLAASAQPNAPARGSPSDAPHLTWAGAVQWPIILGGAWLSVSILLLLGSARAAWKAHLIGRRARRIDVHTDAVAAAAQRLRVQTLPEIRIATDVSVPAVTGLFRPLIVIPRQDWEALSREELVQVLVHEGAHALRRDPLWILLQRLTGALFWVHPLVHVLGYRLNRAREEICDNFVLCDTPREVYGNTLLRLATRAHLAPAGALSLLGGGWRLEHRIAGILDARRSLAVGVHRPMALASILSVVVVSLAIACSRAGAGPEEAVADVTVADDFSIELFCHGESDKPCYHLVLNLGRTGTPGTPFTLVEMIDSQQASRIREHLKVSGFFERAVEASTPETTDTGPRYLLQVTSNHKRLREDLGWHLGMLYQLDALRTALDSDAARAMDQLLGRLAGHRQEWEQAETVEGLTSRLTAMSGSFSAGHPVGLKLEVMNVGDRERSFGQHLVSVNDSFDVRNQLGHVIPYLHGTSAVQESLITLAPGETRVIEELDLAESYYLRRPGHYTVQFRGNGLPRSACLHLKITGDPAATADGDPIGLLLPLVRTGWSFVAGPSTPAKLQPGANWSETDCRRVSFIFNGPAHRDEAGIIAIWLATEPAAPADNPESSLPHTDYLGRVGRWHVYYLISDNARRAWPEAQNEIVAALGDYATRKTAGAPAETQAAARPVQQQVRMPQFEVEQIHPSMRDSPLWRDLRSRLRQSAVRFRVVDIDENGRIRLSLAATPATDLSHLQGVPLWSLDLSNTAVRDLTPLQGMPLEFLDLSGSQVVDLAPLSGMKLKRLNLSGLSMKDLSPLRDAELVEFVAIGTPIEDLSPLSDMPLTYLDLRRTRVHDLTPLAGLPLETVQLEDSPIRDLAPLVQTPVSTLWLGGLGQIDLLPLSGMSIHTLILKGRNVTEISALEGMQLSALTLEDTAVVDLTPITKLPLQTLSLTGTHISDLTPLGRMSLKNIYLSEPGTDLTPLKGMLLETIALPPLSATVNIDLLRNMPTLKWIRPPDCKPLKPEEFWRMYDSRQEGSVRP